MQATRARGEYGEGFWRERAEGAAAVAGTPALVFAEEPLEEQARRLGAALAGLPVRHWWSFKTLPLRPAVAAWRGWGHGVEVVSEFELRAVLGMGVPAADILVNGPAKQEWLLEHGTPGLRVNFDSLAEVQALASMAARREWRVGLRLNTLTEENFEFPGIRTQFGLLPHEVKPALRTLKREGLVPEVLHFHLRTNVAEARCYREAALEALGLAAEAGWTPKVLDIGGGFPPERVATRKGTPLDAGFSLASLREALVAVRAKHRLLEAIWMENGRWLTAPAGVLVVRVLDVKEGRGLRTLICDGGRTLQAMVATWERHALFALEARRGKRVRTLVCGPTCMAFDNLGVHELASTVRAGDRLVWRDAGAYQLSWETRFSHGLGAVVWTAAGSREVVRTKETFEEWVSGR
jgi:diaminopimelate decarboxylase